MPRYFARVELHKADYDDYEAFKETMKKEGFSHCHRVGDETLKKLPTGLYVGNLQETSVAEVAKRVKKRADATDLANEVVVIESANSASRLSKNCN
jgi:hypothetical protein